MLYIQGFGHATLREIPYNGVAQPATARRHLHASPIRGAVGIMTESSVCQWCQATGSLELADFDVKVANSQVDFEHMIYRCDACSKLTAYAHWGQQAFVYKALEYPRTLRSPLNGLVYEIACGWCGRADMLEPEEINATIANPASARHRYDIYACHACERYTAASYLGQVYAYPATQDARYHALYYLEVGEDAL